MLIRAKLERFFESYHLTFPISNAWLCNKPSSSTIITKSPLDRNHTKSRFTDTCWKNNSKFDLLPLKMLLSCSLYTTQSSLHLEAWIPVFLAAVGPVQCRDNNRNERFIHFFCPCMHILPHFDSLHINNRLLYNLKRRSSNK